MRERSKDQGSSNRIVGALPCYRIAYTYMYMYTAARESEFSLLAAFCGRIKSRIFIGIEGSRVIARFLYVHALKLTRVRLSHADMLITRVNRVRRLTSNYNFEKIREKRRKFLAANEN